MLDRARRHQTALSVALLGLLAYLPALTASPGRMPTDSKLYVYLNPGRFIADTTTTFDPRQFAGWVPHQHIAYLWPTGPWFWFFETLGVPDWIAHRLWIGTILFAAGLGVRWLARVLGFSPLAALTAALVYQLSPYILPYISRTSVLLLPYAGLGWIVGCTVLAARRGGWRYPAAIALIVFTVGAVNATALAMVIPAPVLWLVHTAWQRSVTIRQAVMVAAKTALLSIAVSLWWIVMLMIQGRHGADVLAFSESLESVSFTSTSTEVSRGLGYWLFYVRDAYAATTTASLDHLVSGRTVFAGFVVIAIGLLGITATRWEHRRFAALLFGAGVILGVGVHPIDDPSPLMSLLVGDGEGGLALALRSSTRAVPVMLLGVGLGAAALVQTIGASWIHGRSRVPPRVLRVGMAAVVGLTAIVALPALRNGGFVDEALERDQAPPQAWLDAADDLDARPDGFRLLQVPGTEFGAFQWGYTVDQPLPGLTERPLVTRDLLPLGSPAAMDLVFALDDRFQSDTIEPAAVATVSRLLGVDTVWVSGDVSFDRFRLARPEVVTDEMTSADAAEAGLPTVTAYGEPTVMNSVIPMIDNRSLTDGRIGSPIAPVTLVDVADPIPTVRVKDTVVVLAGSGDGIIDASAAGLIDGTEAILYAAAGPTPDGPYRFVLTDSARDRAHHWRSSQDVSGFTESALDASDVLRFESGDQRLDVLPGATGDDQTVSVQDGPVTARASSYGERFAYLPEHRPARAIDGDPTTAWIVADRAPAIGEFIELAIDTPIDFIDLLQPAASETERTITLVDVSVNGLPAISHVLDERSRTGTGQRIEIDSTLIASGQAALGDDPALVTITITGTTTPQPPIGEAIGGVGFVEIGTGLEPTVEWIRTPVSEMAAMAEADGVDVVFTRLRTEPTDRWRDDPEPALARRFELGRELDVDTQVTLRLDQRLHGRALAELLGEPAFATSSLLGAPSARGAAAFDGDASTAWVTNFDDAVGAAVTVQGSGTATQLTIAQPAGDFSPITTLRVSDPAGAFDIEVVAGSEPVIALPRPIDLASVSLEILTIEERFTQNRRFNEPTVLPAAISEVRFDDESPTIRPSDRLGTDCSDRFLELDGTPVSLRFDIATLDALAGDPIDAQVCSAPSLSAGTHELLSQPGATTGFHVDRVVFSERVGTRGTTSEVDPTEPIVVESSSRHRVVEIPPCPNGCWLVHGEGFNPAWRASIEGVTAGEPTLIDGNANGWWIPPTTEPTRAEITWPVQRQLNIAFVLTLLALAACVALIVRGRRRSDEPETEALALHTDQEAATTRSQFIAGVVTAFGAGLFISWPWMVAVGVVWVVATLIKRPAMVGFVGVAIVAGAGLVVTSVVRDERPFPDAGWPVRFEWLHGWTLLGVVLVVGSTLLSGGTRTPQDEA